MSTTVLSIYAMHALSFAFCIYTYLLPGDIDGCLFLLLLDGTPCDISVCTSEFRIGLLPPPVVIFKMSGSIPIESTIPVNRDISLNDLFSCHIIS